MAVKSLPPQRQGMKRKTRENVAGWLFLTPYLISLIVFTFGAIAYAVYISFTDLKLFGEANYVGFGTYGRVLDPTNPLNKFWKALGNTVIFSVVVVFFQTWLAILFAVVLNSKIRGQRFFRIAWYLPSVTASVVISLIFFWMYKQQGVINYALGAIINNTLGLVGVHFEPVAWLDNTTTALPAIMTMNIFTTIPTFMVMFLAGLQDIPTDVYEAAKIDGASARRMFWSITLPLLRPVIFLVTVLGTIGTLQVFDQIYVMTNEGGPLDSTLTVAYLIWFEAFKRNNLARSAAISFILFVVIFVFFLVQRRFLDRNATD